MGQDHEQTRFRHKDKEAAKWLMECAVRRPVVSGNRYLANRRGTVEMSNSESNAGPFGEKISVVGCFQAVEGKTVFYINQFMRINKFPDEIRNDVIDTIREMLPNVCIMDDQ